MSDESPTPTLADARRRMHAALMFRCLPASAANDTPEQAELRAAWRELHPFLAPFAPQQEPVGWLYRWIPERGSPQGWAYVPGAQHPSLGDRYEVKAVYDRALPPGEPAAQEQEREERIMEAARAIAANVESGIWGEQSRAYDGAVVVPTVEWYATVIRRTLGGAGMGNRGRR